MLRGIYHISLDTKGRLSVPVKVRAQFEAESEGMLILTTDLENQLLLYTLPEWQQVEEKLVKLPSFDPQIRRLRAGLLPAVSGGDQGPVAVHYCAGRGQG